MPEAAVLQLVCDRMRYADSTAPKAAVLCVLLLVGGALRWAVRGVPSYAVLYGLLYARM